MCVCNCDPLPPVHCVCESISVCASEEAAVQAAACARSGTLKQNQDTARMCVCLHLHVCLYLGAYVCARVGLGACVCVLVCMQEGVGEGGEFGHPSVLGYFATVSAGARRHTHTHIVAHIVTHTHTQRALCQASCSLAGAGNAPERVVASICSTGERLG